MNYEQLKLGNQLCFPFYAVSRLITRAYQDDLNALAITYPQYIVLLVLWENDSIPVNTIAEKLILNTNTVTPLLKRMEVMGLLVRQQSKTDQRKIIISLTKQGIELQEKAAQIPMHLIEKLQIESSKQSIRELQSLRNKLYELINLLKHTELI